MVNTNLDRNYIFPNDLAPNEIQFFAKSVGKALSVVDSIVECSFGSVKRLSTIQDQAAFISRIYLARHRMYKVQIPFAIYATSSRKAFPVNGSRSKAPGQKPPGQKPPGQ